MSKKVSFQDKFGSRVSRVFVFFILSFPLGCNPTKQVADSCVLTPGDYEVQNAVYKADNGVYELMVLGAPACFHQPLVLKNLQLARFETAEAKEKVKLSYGGEDSSILRMAEDFQIKMVQTVTENGVHKEQVGSWSPFLTGLAGGVAGGVVGGVAGSMLGRALTKPQHYTPPPMEPGQTNLRGFGGAGDTRDGAIKSYQQKYSTSPQAHPVEIDRGVKSGTEPSSNKSFFRTKSEPTVNSRSGAVRTYQPSSQRAPRQKFFKSRGR